MGLQRNVVNVNNEVDDQSEGNDNGHNPVNSNHDDDLYDHNNDNNNDLPDDGSGAGVSYQFSFLCP